MRSNDFLQSATEDRYNVRFSAGSGFAEKLTRLAEVLGIESPQNHLEEILSCALDIALEEKTRSGSWSGGGSERRK
jgi:hypothetical protein